MPLAIKQTSVTSRKHLARLKSYLDRSRDKVLIYDTQDTVDTKRQLEKLDETAEHNTSGNAGTRCAYVKIDYNPTNSIALAE